MYQSNLLENGKKVAELLNAALEKALLELEENGHSHEFQRYIKIASKLSQRSYFIDLAIKSPVFFIKDRYDLNENIPKTAPEPGSSWIVLQRCLQNIKLIQKTEDPEVGADLADQIEKNIRQHRIKLHPVFGGPSDCRH